MKPTKREVAKEHERFSFWKATAFFGTLVIFGFIGLLWFARPTTSTVEKRELTPFPQLTLAGILDGSFFSGVDTWYADTYPLREGMITLDQGVENLYGLRGEQLVAGGQTGEEIPTGPVDLAELAGRDRDTEATEQTGESGTATEPSDVSGSGEPSDSETQESETAQTDPPAGQGDVTTPAELTGTIYITENCGYGVYYFSQSASARYCMYVNSVAKACEGKATVYSLIGPISAGIMLSDDVREQIGASDENAAMTWMFENMDPLVKTVNVYQTLKQHNNEYIYFHTDHHWTALGAYYAYCEFCRVKGIEPHKLSDFDTYVFEDFLGTFYSSSNKSPALAANPDTVTAYIPNGTNSMEMYVSNGNGTYTKYNWRVVNDVSNYVKSELYATFAGGDQPFNYAHNENITDGSAVLVVKDSYANAFIPFLVDHYEHIYWIDYRSYRSWCAWAGVGDVSISNFVERNGITDVILLNNINSTGSSSLLDCMEAIGR